MGRVLRAHGTQGVARLRLSCALRELHAWPLQAQLLRPGGAAPVLLTLGRLRGVAANEWLADLGGRHAREQVDAWRGAELWLPEGVLPPTDDGQIYLFTLIGAQARRPQGDVLGEVVAVYDHGAGAILGLRRTPGGPEDLLLPLAIVRILASEGGHVTLDVPDDLLDAS